MSFNSPPRFGKHSDHRTSDLLAGVFTAVESLSDGLFTVDRDNRITYMNPAAEALTGWSLEDALGRPSGIVFRLIDAVTRKVTWQPIGPAIQDDRQYTLLPNTLLIRKDLTETQVHDLVSPIHDEFGEVAGAVITFRDVEANHALLSQVLKRLHRDPLTGLPDRTLLQERFEEVRSSAPDETSYTLLYLDVDNFKQVNDTHGHLAGDFVLQTIANRVRVSIPEQYLVCRLGGDEFAALIEEPYEGFVESPLIHDLLGSLQRPILFAGTLLEATISLGVAVSKERWIGFQDLLGYADKSMYRAKRAGGNRFDFIRHPPPRTLACSTKEHLGDEESVVLHFQPIVDLCSGTVTGAEALLRWQEPHGELALPADVISRAERDGSIVWLGQTVLRQALQQQARWRNLGHGELTMNVNVSPVELMCPTYLKELDQILEEEPFVKESVILEVTESVLLHSEQQGTLLREVAKRGLRIAVDDFGVGYSNLSYLRRLPISIIKIDREFLRQVPASQPDSSLLKTMIEMSRTLDLAVIAEGVETEPQRQFLLEHACGQAQGFLFSPGIAAGSFEALLREKVKKAPTSPSKPAID